MHGLRHMLKDQRCKSPSGLECQKAIRGFQHALFARTTRSLPVLLPLEALRRNLRLQEMNKSTVGRLDVLYASQSIEVYLK